MGLIAEFRKKVGETVWNINDVNKDKHYPKKGDILCRHCTTHPEKITRKVLWKSCPIHEWQDNIKYRWIDFLMDNHGFDFLSDRGERLTKLQAWYRFMYNEHYLHALTKDMLVGWHKIEKEDWKDGEYIGLDAENLPNNFKTLGYGLFKDSVIKNSQQ